MNTADLISAYLNNEMSPERERQFLLSVASNDQLRLALKSNVMLDRIVLRQAQEIEVPDAVRSSILAQAASAAALPTQNTVEPVRRSANGGSTAGSLSNGVVLAVLAVGIFIGGYVTRVGLERTIDVQHTDNAQSTDEHRATAVFTAAGISIEAAEALASSTTAAAGLHRAARLLAADAGRAGVVRPPIRTGTASGVGREYSMRLSRLPDVSKSIPASELGNPLDPASDRLIRSKNVPSEGETVRNGMPPVPAAPPPAVRLDMSIQHGNGGDNRP